MILGSTTQFAALAQIPSKVFTADDVLSNYVYVFCAAYIVAFLFTPVMRAIAIYYGIIDQPDRLRKMHAAPVAYLGGVAVFVGWLAGLVVSQYLTLHRADAGWPTSHPIVRFSIVMGATIIVLLGLWDDVLGLRPWMKILGQLFAALFMLADGIGVRSAQAFITPFWFKIQQFIHGPMAIAPEVPDWLVFSLSALLVIAIVVGCCNASNLLDGLDGLCGGVTAIIAAGFLFVAVHLAMIGGGINTNWDALRVIIGLALLGAVLGFIPYNFNPASIFMGDTGSMFLGYVCATMMILMAHEHAKWLLASMVIFALPILDTFLAFARRWVNKRPLFSADKQHFHHQLVARGFSVKQTVLISYGLACFFGLLGISMLFMRTRYAGALYLVTFGSIMVTAYKIGMIHERPATSEASTLGDTTVDAFDSGQITPAGVLEIPGDIATPSGDLIASNPR